MLRLRSQPFAQSSFSVTNDPMQNELIRQLHLILLDRVDGEALDEFKNLELGQLDYEYIISHCYHTVAGGKGNELVRKWAVQKLGAKAGDSGIIQTSDEPKKRARIKTAS